MRRRLLLPVLILIFSVALASGCVGKQARQVKVAPPPSPTLPHGFFHVMQPGDTLYRLATLYDLPIEALIRFNEIDDNRQIPVGAKIFIPLDHGKGSRAPMRQSATFLWPVRGTLYSRFGSRGRRFHSGIDISAPRGSTIRATAAGRVTFSGSSGNAYGRYIKIQHSSSTISLYAHNSANLVKRGEWVKQGQAIARVGNTGNATGPHCHFEIQRNGAPINPLPLLSHPSSAGLQAE